MKSYTDDTTESCVSRDSVCKHLKVKLFHYSELLQLLPPGYLKHFSIHSLKWHRLHKKFCCFSVYLNQLYPVGKQRKYDDVAVYTMPRTKKKRSCGKRLMFSTASLFWTGIQTRHTQSSRLKRVTPMNEHQLKGEILKYRKYNGDDFVFPCQKLGYKGSTVLSKSHEEFDNTGYF